MAEQLRKDVTTMIRSEAKMMEKLALVTRNLNLVIDLGQLVAQVRLLYYFH